MLAPQIVLFSLDRMTFVTDSIGFRWSILSIGIDYPWMEPLLVPSLLCILLSDRFVEIDQISFVSLIENDFVFERLLLP